ncbi:hypothetical protein D9M68_511840 [compost metagenome]
MDPKARAAIRAQFIKLLESCNLLNRALLDVNFLSELKKLAKQIEKQRERWMSETDALSFLYEFTDSLLPLAKERTKETVPLTYYIEDTGKAADALLEAIDEIPYKIEVSFPFPKIEKKQNRFNRNWRAR